jgi:hypothetical protein
MIATRPMPVRRSWKRTLLWAAAALFFLWATAYMALLASYFYALLLGLFAVLAVAALFYDPYVSNCPVCEAELRGLMGLKRCPRCFAYGKIVQGSYYELEPGYTHNIAALAVPLYGGRIMPPLCCACGAAASRLERLRIIRVGFAFDLDVPHCAQHTAGADLDAESAGKKTETPVLKVKSYAFYRACIAANYPQLTRR